jgi:hypothetical protein
MYPIEQPRNRQRGRLHLQEIKRFLENGDHMPQSKYDNAADLHIHAAHAHTAAAAAHHRGDHEAAEELSSKAQDYSMMATDKTAEIAKQAYSHLKA